MGVRQYPALERPAANATPLDRSRVSHHKRGPEACGAVSFA